MAHVFHHATSFSRTDRKGALTTPQLLSVSHDFTYRWNVPGMHNIFTNSIETPVYSQSSRIFDASMHFISGFTISIQVRYRRFVRSKRVRAKVGTFTVTNNNAFVILAAKSSAVTKLGKTRLPRSRCYLGTCKISTVKMIRRTRDAHARYTFTGDLRPQLGRWFARAAILSRKAYAGLQVFPCL